MPPNDEQSRLQEEAKKWRTDSVERTTADRLLLSQVVQDVGAIKVALLGPFGKGGGALAKLDEVYERTNQAHNDAREAKGLAADNRKRLNAMSGGNAIYTTVAAVIAAAVGWFGGGRT